jgi:hypothetical protein
LVPADVPGNTTSIVTRDRILVSLSTKTGNVAVYPVNITNGADSWTGNADLTKCADDPFKFAELGGVAGQ